MRLMSELDLAGRRVLIREDLNVPLRDGEITNDARLRAAAPSILAALDQGAAVIVMSHLGRPTEGEWSEEASMAPIADDWLSSWSVMCCWRPVATGCTAPR